MVFLEARTTCTEAERFLGKSEFMPMEGATEVPPEDPRGKSMLRVRRGQVRQGEGLIMYLPTRYREVQEEVID